MELSEGYAVGPYRLVGRAGAGGMADVWRAYDARLKRYVAIKFLSPRYATDQLYLDRFRHEAQAISRLDHPNILMIHDYGEQDGWTYMVSPYVGGGTLAAQLRRGPWTIEETIAVLEPLASALDYAHGEGIVHRDVKPSNVLFTERGRLVLSDFGIARMVEGSTLLSQAGLIVGTPMYMSPEQADGQRVTGASDLYSLGVIAYEMLTGRPPFMAETPLALLRAHIDKPLPPPRTLNPALPEPVEAVLFTIMAKDPVHRFASGGAFVNALRNSRARVAPTSTPAPSPVPDPLREPTLPLDASEVHLGDAGPLSDAVEPERSSHPSVPSYPRPTASTLPLDATAPTVAAEPGGVVWQWLVPLATMAFAWAIAWTVLLTMRASIHVSFYDTTVLYPDGDSEFLAASAVFLARSIVGAVVGAVGAAGIVVGLRAAGWRIDGRSALLLVIGWALIYGIAHGLLYLGALGLRYAYIDQLDEILVFFEDPDPPGLVVTHLIDVLPATLGAGLLAYLCRREAPGAAAWIILGWTLAAVLAVLSVAVLEPAMEHNVFGDLMSGDRRFGLVAGGIAGVIFGLVGGGVTLWALRRR